VGSGGSDAAAGTSYALRWLTIGKALGAAGIASGDTLYIAPGTYRESVTVNMTTATVETLVIGDYDGSHTSAAPGPIIWTGFTTDDTTAAVAAACLILNGRDFLTFRNIWFIGGNALPGCVNAQTTHSSDIKFTDCAMTTGMSQTAQIIVTAAAGSALNWTISRCFIQGMAANAAEGAIRINATRHSADYDMAVVIENCVVIGASQGLRVTSAGAGAGFGGGVTVRNCRFQSQIGIVAATASLSTTYPIVVSNCVLLDSSGLDANTLGQITEDYNIIVATTARTNVTAGANSKANLYDVSAHVGQEYVWGGQLRPFGTPKAGSPVLGFGDDGTAPATDLVNRARPEGGASVLKAAGALERHDTAVKETGTTDAGSVGWAIVGPGSQRIFVAVNAASTVITVRARYDTTHDVTNKPQAILRANGEIGVSTETKTMTSAADTWETLTFSTFTPTAKGVVMIDLISRAAAGSGKAFFDTISVT